MLYVRYLSINWYLQVQAVLGLHAGYHRFQLLEIERLGPASHMLELGMNFWTARVLLVCEQHYALNNLHLNSERMMRTMVPPILVKNNKTKPAHPLGSTDTVRIRGCDKQATRGPRHEVKKFLSLPLPDLALAGSPISEFKTSSSDLKARSIVKTTSDSGMTVWGFIDSSNV